MQREDFSNKAILNEIENCIKILEGIQSGNAEIIQWIDPTAFLPEPSTGCLIQIPDKGVYEASFDGISFSVEFFSLEEKYTPSQITAWAKIPDGPIDLNSILDDCTIPLKKVSQGQVSHTGSFSDYSNVATTYFYPDFGVTVVFTKYDGESVPNNLKFSDLASKKFRDRVKKDFGITP